MSAETTTTGSQGLIRRFLQAYARFVAMGDQPTDSEDGRMQHHFLINVSLLMSMGGLFWGSVTAYYGEWWRASIPLGYSLMTYINLYYFYRTKNFRVTRLFQVTISLALPFMFQWALGGYVASGAMMLWGLFALDEIDSVVECIEQGAEDYLTKPFKPALLKARLNASLGKKKLRDLEVAYLQQEMALRESEKLATLGTLSAGMAHELNNPAAAAQRGVGQMRDSLADLRQLQVSLAAADLSPAQAQALDQLLGPIQQQSTALDESDALARSDLEYEMETILEERGVAEPWACAPSLVSVGINTAKLDQIVADFEPAQLPTIIAFLSNNIVAAHTLDDLSQGTMRITEIVTALKSYSFLDQAPIQSVDIHKGLEDTLVMVGSRLDGVVVQRDFAEELPAIQASGSELNQVWTSIIDNAIAAMDGVGEITLYTRSEEPWLVVQITDNGPGIPAEIQPHIFDPFFTTKAPGEGAGLGLTSCHRIIVQQHKGEIRVCSEPGKTGVEVRLPLTG